MHEVGVGMHVTAHTWKVIGQLCGVRSFLIVSWVQEIKLRSSDLASVSLPTESSHGPESILLTNSKYQGEGTGPGLHLENQLCKAKDTFNEHSYLLFPWSWQ